MRITILSAALDLSGGSRVIATYARMLQDNGHAVKVVALAPYKTPLRRRVKNLLVTGRWDRGLGKVSHYDGLGLDTHVVDGREITEHDVPDADVIIATWWETAEWINRFSANKGTKVYLVQGHEVFDGLHVERVKATYHMPFFKIVVSGWLQRIMAQTYGDYSAELVPNAVDHTVFNAPPRGHQPVPTVGFMYGSGQLKGSDLAIAAIERMRRDLSKLRVVSFGSSWPQRRARLRDTEFTHLPSPDRLRDIYSCADVWLCSSRSEGFGLPAMEAMACRTPVVSTRVGWPSDSIEHGVNGYLVASDDAQALGDAALACLRLDDAAWRTMSDRAYDTARSYNWRRSYGQFYGALQQAIAQDTLRTLRQDAPLTTS